MEQRLQDLLGNLRGRTPPSEAILERLYGINPRLRLTWTPGRAERQYAKSKDPAVPALWWLWEVGVVRNKQDRFREEQRRKVGELRLARFRKWPLEQQLKFRDRMFQADAMWHGYWFIDRYEEGQFATDTFFRNLEIQERERLIQLDRIYRGREEETAEEMQEEFQENKAFREYVNAAAREHYQQVAGINQEGWTPAIEGVTDGTALNGRESELANAGAGRERLDGPAGPEPTGGAAPDGEPGQRPARGLPREKADLRPEGR